MAAVGDIVVMVALKGVLVLSVGRAGAVMTAVYDAIVMVTEGEC